MKYRLLLSLLGLVLMNGCSNQMKNDLTAAQIPQRLNRKVNLGIDYLLYLPEDYNTTQQDFPLIVFLHGIGERGTDVNQVKSNGLPKRIEQGNQFPFIVVSPQCPTQSWWTHETSAILALIDEISEAYRVDTKRIYLTGLSMGGFGTWSIAGVHPDRFAAIAPICGGGYTFMTPNMKNLPIWAFHGDADQVVPVEKSKEMVEAVNNVGGNAKLTIYPGVNHDSWTQTYENDELYEWFLLHSK